MLYANTPHRGELALFWYKRFGGSPLHLSCE